MKYLKRLVAWASVITVLWISLPLESLAASSKTISSVIIYVGLKDLEEGKTLPSEVSFKTTEKSGNYVCCNNNRYEVTDLNWITSDNKEMMIGSKPKMKVTLRAIDSDEYAFKGGYNSGNVSIKGGEYVTSSRSRADTLYVTFTFNPLKGTYNSPESASWGDSGIGDAEWSEGEYSSGAYDVYLYRGKTIIQKVECLKKTSYNFYPYMTKAGSYIFKVRTTSGTETEKKYGKKSEWTESDEAYLTEENVSDGSGQNGSWNSNSEVGWIRKGNTWYYKYPDGTYQKSWANINNKWYMFNSSGMMVIGWKQSNDHWYYFNSNGDMVTGWIVSGNNWYYLNPSLDNGVEGAMHTGWRQINGNWYYFNTNGSMAIGWVMSNNRWYYLNPSAASGVEGTMMTGWIVSGNNWYYLNPSLDNGVEGAMHTGWRQINGNWYYFNTNGSMATGWVMSNNRWYYLNPSSAVSIEGAMVTGWVFYNNKWYYTDSAGAMQSGWKQINKNWYYFNSDGAMAVNTIINGFFIDKDGTWYK
ncbi:N-acetylmuramoyl-L-alanine amidase family protein [Lacrimispora celerecrescens]|uniref:Glucan-binding YG repeat protein n=3 Tax=Lacrimispora celerecrescens TaxID=29354 RepID=A0A2M8Z322_9FIRM|nr:N-acetylmuramoyl-L-alanine amidase family protein [Lacrimispora celerecrescens]PJJ27844.1 glucan-binding YG repeat protein [[Clostridium] celerecrescens 18A]